MTTQAPFTPRTIGETENALRAMLTRTLEGTGLDYHRWVALKLAADAGMPTPPATLAAQLRGGLKVGEEAASQIVRDLESQGLLARERGDVKPSSKGWALYERLSAKVQETTRRMWAGLTPEDLETAHRVLSTIASRANALLAS